MTCRVYARVSVQVIGGMSPGCLNPGIKLTDRQIVPYAFGKWRAVLPRAFGNEVYFHIEYRNQFCRILSLLHSGRDISFHSEP